MDMIPGTILKLIWNYQFLALELPQSEVGESQGKPITLVSYPYTIDVYAWKFQSADKLVFVCPS